MIRRCCETKQLRKKTNQPQWSQNFTSGNTQNQTKSRKAGYQEENPQRRARKKEPSQITRGCFRRTPEPDKCSLSAFGQQGAATRYHKPSQTCEKKEGPETQMMTKHTATPGTGPEDRCVKPPAPCVQPQVRHSPSWTKQCEHQLCQSIRKATNKAILMCCILIQSGKQSPLQK